MFFVFDMEVYICWLQIKSIYGFKKKKKKVYIQWHLQINLVLSWIRYGKRKKVTRKEENFNFVF